MIKISIIHLKPTLFWRHPLFALSNISGNNVVGKPVQAYTVNLKLAINTLPCFLLRVKSFVMGDVHELASLVVANGISFFQLALRRSRSRVTNHNKNKTGASSYLRGSRSFYYWSSLNLYFKGYNFKSIDWSLNSYLTNANKHVFVLRVFWNKEVPHRRFASDIVTYRD